MIEQDLLLVARTKDLKIFQKIKIYENVFSIYYFVHLDDFGIKDEILDNLVGLGKALADVVPEDASLAVQVPSLEQVQQALLVPQLERRLEHVPGSVIADLTDKKTYIVNSFFTTLYIEL